MVHTLNIMKVMLFYVYLIRLPGCAILLQRFVIF